MPTLKQLHLALDVLLVVACACLYAWGSHEAGRCATSTTQVTTLQQQVQTLTQRATESSHDVKTTVQTVQKPDGTKVTTTTHEHLTTHEAEQDTSHIQSQASEREVSQTVTPVGSDLARYSLGVAWTPLSLGATPWMPEALDVGARLGNLPLWLTAGATQNAAGRWLPTVGIRIDF